MSSYFRLRQICLVVPDLARAVADIEPIFGVNVCYSDPAVGQYGLLRCSASSARLSCSHD